PLPASFEVKIAASESPKELVHSIDETVSQWKGIDEVVYQQGMVDSMDANLGKFKLLLLIFGGVLLLISLILLQNTIRMSVFSRRELISTMKLVGATKGFIKRPFMKDAFWMGVVAATLASLMFWVMLVALSEGMPYVVLLSGVEVMGCIFGGIYVAGILISLLFSSLVLDRFVAMNSAKINIY
ncbi:MAG: ABC transporter permease, partial [Tidjanibacter sp.]|nr:ABC transporter permease [Tidjanibacter sp.]